MAGSASFNAAAQALESLQIINQPMASIAKKEEILYVFGQRTNPSCWSATRLSST